LPAVPRRYPWLRYAHLTGQVPAAALSELDDVDAVLASDVNAIDE
jgi:hypothetical protein